MTDDEKNRIRSRVEDILNSILSRKHDMDIKIQFKPINSEKDDEKKKKNKS